MCSPNRTIPSTTERSMRTGKLQINKTRGFTLIEVMVALVIVSIGMVAVIQAVSQAANNGAYLRDKSIAQWVALNQLTLMRIAQASPVKGTTTGEIEMAGQRWRWAAQVIETSVASMKRIDIAVRAAESPEDSQLATITGFYGDKNGKPGVQIVQFTPVPPVPNAKQDGKVDDRR